jgi:trehalose 6-phosphate synthase/phosphatase
VALASVLTETHRTRPIRLLLDYDGTLVPLARSPELAAPDDELMAILGAVSSCPWITPAIVSGRSHETLESWFGHLPMPLWAEHGFWHRPSRGAAWAAAARVDVDWTKRLLPILKDFTSRTPGSRIELKSTAIAWHFRGAQREFGARQAHELRMLLGQNVRRTPNRTWRPGYEPPHSSRTTRSQARADSGCYGAFGAAGAPSRVEVRIDRSFE